MCKVSVTERNKKRIELELLYREKRKELKQAIIKETNLKEKVKLIQKLDNLKKDSSKVRIRNRCNLTGRPRGVIGRYGICRNQLYKMLVYIPGIRKASW